MTRSGKVNKGDEECAVTNRPWMGWPVALDLHPMEPNGGQVLYGVTAHGSPGGPLQFDRLGAALTARFRWSGSKSRWV